MNVSAAAVMTADDDHDAKRRMRPSIPAAAGSGYRGSQAVVRPGLPIARTGDACNTENKVCVRVYIASIHVDDVGLLDQRFTLLKCELDAVVPRFDLEGEPAGVIRVPMLTLAGFDVDDVNAASLDRARAFRTANSAANRAIGFERFRAQIDDGAAMARRDGAQGNHDGPKPNRLHVIRQVEAKFPHSNLARPKLQARGHLARPCTAVK